MAINKLRKRQDEKRDYACILYMQRVQQNDIAERVGVSQKTITAWKDKFGWETKRASKNISIDELVAKTLKKINDLLDEESFNADAFAKAVAQLKTFKVKNTVDDEVMCFMDFQNFLLERRTIENIDENFLRQITKLQDQFIQYRMGNGQ